MKKILFFLIITCVPYAVFSQYATNNQDLKNNKKENKYLINWISLNKAKKYAKKYNQKILIYFFKEDCPYCEKMKKETLDDPYVSNLINENFLPVKINSRTKDTIVYRNKEYTNQQPQSHGSTWRHDFYYEVAKFGNKGQVTTPSIVLFDNKFEKIRTIPGQQPKQQLIRTLNKILN